MQLWNCLKTQFFSKKGSPILSRADDLSRRIIECASVDSFDRDRANLMKAREVAYWLAWLELTAADDAGDGDALLAAKAAIEELANFSF